MSKFVSRDIFEVGVPRHLIGWTLSNIIDTDEKIRLVFKNEHGVECYLTATLNDGVYISDCYAGDSANE